MDNQELKNILIGELGSMPFKDKKIIKDEGGIPKDLMERLIVKDLKRKKFAKIAIIVLAILAVLSMFACFWIDEDCLPFVLFSSMAVSQLVQVSLRPGFIDNSKRELVFKLFKTMDDQGLNS